MTSQLIEISSDILASQDGSFYQVFQRQDIYDYLKLYVSGQEELLDKLSFMAHLYSRKVYNIYNGVDLKVLPKTNFLITGPTGCGKTYIIKTLAESMGLAYTRIDCSAVTGEGWVGANISDFIEKYVKRSPNGVGILHLDEFDKLGMDGEGEGRGRQMIREKQTGMLDLLDQSYAGLSKEPKQLEVDLTGVNNSFIIMSGSFQSFREEQKKLKDPIGFKGVKEDNEKRMKNWRLQLKELGFLTELSNRILASAELEPYTREQIKEIITSKENNTYHKFLDLINNEYAKLTNEQLEKIIDNVHESENGMRELEAMVFEEIFNNEVKAREKF